MNKRNDELLQKAFDINVKNEDYYPTTVHIDQDIDNEATAYLQRTINEAQQIESVRHLQTRNSTNTDNTGNDDDSEIEMNVHPDNVEVLRYQIYEHLNVSAFMVEEIKKEYECMKSKCMGMLKEGKERAKKLNVVNMIKDFGKCVRPEQDVLVNNVFPYLNNNYCFVQIKFIYRVIYSHKILINVPSKVLYEWLYFFLIVLKMPLVDDQNAFLYKINKHIFKQNKTTLTTQDKIIAIIISEIFNQKINIF